MINNINSIENLGIYKEYKKDTKLQPFSRFNLFYGWNGSGKTTISRLFRMIEKKDISDDYNNLKFTIEVDLQKYTEKNFKDINENIFVFNEEFIEENINWDERINKILLLSEDKINETKEYKLIKEEINGNEVTKTIGLKNKYLEENEKVNKEYKSIEDSYSRIAKNIKTLFQTIDPSDKEYASFNKSKIQNILDNQSELKEIIEDLQTEENIDNLIVAAKNEKKEIINYTKNDIKKDSFISLYNKIKETLMKVVTAKVIERLRNNDDISNWVNRGLELNQKYKNEVCEFCGNIIPKKRIEELEEHFNDEVSKIKEELENLSNNLKKYNIKQNETIIDKFLFYKENSSNIELLNNNIIGELLKLDELIKKIDQCIEEKKDNPFKKIELDETEKVEKILDNYNAYITVQEQYVKETNDRTINFEKQTKEIKKKLAKYYLKNEFKNEDIINKIEKYKKNKDKIDIIKQNLESREKRLNELESALSNESLGAEKFNEKLNVFLGYDELRLEFNKELKGYEIIRKSTNCKAHKLSEGEKTAIAFVYFLTKLKENDNKIENSLVVIDDPISSFDNNKLFSAYSCIKYEFDNSKQIFILTHNFNFFKLIRDWMQTKKNKNDNGTEKYYSIYKVEPNIENGIRVGNIKNAGKSLNQTSEYDYVFDTVYKMKDKELGESEIFNCGNACRKLLEAFLSFKFPKQRGDIFSLLEKAFPNEDEIQNKNRVYKFINAYSHLNVIESAEISDIDTILAESKGIIQIILNKIEQLDEEHYKAMVHNSNSTSEI